MGGAAGRVRLAIALWVVWAFLVWNVIFDRIVVLAGRRYVYAAAVAAQGSGPFLRIADWMPPAVANGIRVATISSSALLALGLVLIAVAARHDAARRRTC
jgi:hypothetical protein